MPVRVEYKRALLKGLYRSAIANSQTLADAIGDALDSQHTLTSNGKIVSFSSGSGYSVSFSAPSGAGINPVEVLEAIEQLDELYDDALIDLGGSPNDESIYNWMKSELIPKRSITHKFRKISL